MFGLIAGVNESRCAPSVSTGRHQSSKNNNEAVKVSVRQWTKLSDESLMLRYADGDAHAFETLYGRHKDALYRFVRRQCGDPDIAFELAHDIWLKLIAARRRYRPTAVFTTYLFTARATA